MLATLAWRNVLRNRRRSVITILSIAVGLAALTFVWAFIDGQNDQMIRNSTRFLAGDAQVHLKGYHDDPTLDLTMVEAQPVLTAASADPRVDFPAPRSPISAMRCERSAPASDANIPVSERCACSSCEGVRRVRNCCMRRSSGEGVSSSTSWERRGRRS